MVLEEDQKVQGVQGVQEVHQEVEPDAKEEPFQEEELQGVLQEAAAVASAEQKDGQEEPVELVEAAVLVGLEDEPEELEELAPESNQAEEVHREELHHTGNHSQEAPRHRKNHSQGPGPQKTFPTSRRD